MNKILAALLFSLLCFNAICNIKPKFDFQNQPQQNFDEWHRVYRKFYDSTEQNIYRFQVWHSNSQLIHEHNEKFKLGLETYQMELNQFADLTTKEFSEKYLSKGFPVNSAGCKTNMKSNEVKSKIDWTQQGVVTEVKKQGECAAGYAFSAISALESAYKISTQNIVPSFSQQQLLDCSRSYQNKGCQGGSIENSLSYVIKNGIISQKDYPYKGKVDNCNYSQNPGFESRWNITSCANIAHNNLQSLKMAVSRQPVAAAIQASHPGFQFYKRGVFSELSCGEHLNHAVLIVGYQGDIWKVKNSFGKQWGEQGYMQIAMKEGSGVCGINKSPSVPII